MTTNTHQSGINDSIQCLGFDVLYVYNGTVRRYRSDFLVRLVNGDFLVLETKGQQTNADDAKHEYMKEWVKAVSAHGGFGQWRFAVVRHPGEIRDMLEQLSVHLRSFSERCTILL